MDTFEINKIIAAVLVTVLIVFGISKVSDVIFSVEKPNIEGYKVEVKVVDAVLPANHPKKELANKKTKFECKISNVKKAVENKIDDKFAKMMGAKDLADLRKQIQSFKS